MSSIIDIFKKYDLPKGPESFKVYLAFANILEAEMQPQFDARQAVLLARMPGLAVFKVNGKQVTDAALLSMIQMQANELLACYRGQLYETLAIAPMPEALTAEEDAVCGRQYRPYTDAALESIEAFENALAEWAAPLTKGRKARTSEKIQHLPLLGRYAALLADSLADVPQLSQTDCLNITAEILLIAGVAQKYSDFTEDSLQENSRDDNAHMVKYWLTCYKQNKADFKAFQPYQWQLYRRTSESAPESKGNAFASNLSAA